MLAANKPLLTAGLLSVLLTAGCTSTSQKPQQTPDFTPANWQTVVPNSQPNQQANTQWAGFNHTQLQAFIAKALKNNLGLKQQAYQLAVSEQQAIQQDAVFLPSLDLSLNQGRSKNNRPVSYKNTSQAELSLSYEVDIWGKLSAQSRQAGFNYLAQQSSFTQAQHSLIAQVINTWLNVIKTQQQITLAEQRVKNTRENLAIIKSGYKQGLNEALDVYLASSEVNSEASNLTQLQQTRLQTIRQLEQLLGEYPAGKLQVTDELPQFDNSLPRVLPSELITRKPQLQQSWYQLLAADANLAYAHKARFPSLNLSASLGDATDSIDDLFSPANLAWSLLGRISAPIFQGGKLKANEKMAELNLKKQEQSYLESLYSAFNEVENYLSLSVSLEQQYQVMEKAYQHASAANQLSFEQYQQGLVSYTTVLDAQKRAFNAQNTLLTIAVQRLQNRVNLNLALGGGFNPPFINQRGVSQ